MRPNRQYHFMMRTAGDADAAPKAGMAREGQAAARKRAQPVERRR
jgi:hypothetical protein